MASYAEITEYMQRCKKSASYFMQTSCKIKHPLIGIIPFRLFKYQISSLKAFRENRFNIFRKCRQAGISTLTGIYALWVAMFFSSKKILIVSKRDLDAKNFLADNVKLVYENLPPWMHAIWGKPPGGLLWNEHEIGFANGSIIRSLTSSPDTLRSNASSLNIIDEAAFMPDMETMWSGGWSCVDTATYLYNDGRISQAGTLGDLDGSQWQDHDITIQSDRGLAKSDKFYINGKADTYTITTSLGLAISCTKNHRLKDEQYEWIYTNNIKIGQNLALKAGHDAGPFFETKLAQQRPAVEPQPFIEAANAATVIPRCECCGRPTAIGYRQYKRNLSSNGKFICQSCSTTDHLSPDFIRPESLDAQLAEMIGYYIGDGSLSVTRPKRFRLCYDPQDHEIYTHFEQYITSLGLAAHYADANGAGSIQIDNAKFVDWFVLNSFNSKTTAIDALIPRIILQSHQSLRAAFLRGLFEADGWCYPTKNSARPNTSRWHLGMSSTSEMLVNQVQLVLLDLGIISKKSPSEGGYENSGPSWRLELPNLDEIIKFKKLIGFISKRKNIEVTKHTDYEPRKFNIDSNGIFYDDVVSIHKSEAMTIDISVPSNNTYIANGFVSHNTLQHGGSVIIISTPNGVGNFYWDKWTDAESDGLFHPILINWWDMDWVIETDDPISGTHIRIAPTDGIRKCSKEEFDKWGPYWSPWLENEFRGLQARGESHLFRQEVLGEFIGGGGTVLDQSALRHVEKTVQESSEPMTISEPVLWVNSATGEREDLDFSGSGNGEGLWVWAEPVKGTPPEYNHGRMVNPGTPSHTYVIGVDIATGENNDYSAIEVFDIDAMEQVAEYLGHVHIATFAKMADWIGRWYGDALINPERTGIGAAFVQDLQSYLYPQIWREKKQRNPKPGSAPTTQVGVTYGNYGFSTLPQTKPRLNKALLTFITNGDDGNDGYIIHSSRLYRQLQIYIRHRDRRGIETKRTGAQDGRGNHDDLVIATALSFVAAPDCIGRDPAGLIPTHSKQAIPFASVRDEIEVDRSKQQRTAYATHDPNVMIPLTFNAQQPDGMSQQEELDRFTQQLISAPRIIQVTKMPKHRY